MIERKRKRLWPSGMKRREDANFDRQLKGRRGSDDISTKLPLVHVTAAWPAKEIIRQGTLTTGLCEVFATELLYFFVLRPAFRSRYGTEASHQISRFPVVFILRAASVKNPLHVYPFDTGGAAKGAFAHQADKFVPLEDYALESSHAAASGFIAWAFGTLANYFEGRLRTNISDDTMPHESVVNGFIDIARMGVEGSNDHDKRASTVELATSHNVDLAGNVDLIILPKQYLEGYHSLEAELGTLQKLGTTIELYDWQPNRSPDEFQKELMRISADWYRRNGVMA